MPLILYRHLLAELLKVFLLTTTVIVVVIAFGSAIKPLAENLLGPAATAKYIALATVPMLQFAIPFAGGFAATIVFHRFATDNEIVAMACCGLSYRRILIPVAAFGVILLAVVFWLVNFAVPHFWTLLKEIITKDATVVLAASIERGEAVSPDGKLSIFADGMRLVLVSPASGVEKRMVLFGVAAIQSDERRRPVTEFTAESATVDLYRIGRETWMKLAMSNATVFRASEGTVAIVPRALPDAVRIDRGFVRTPKYLSLPELVELRRTVDRRGEDFDARRPVDLLLTKIDGWSCLGRLLSGGGRATFVDEANRREYLVDGGVVAGSGISPRDQSPIVVTEYERGVATRRALTQRIDLFFDDELPPEQAPRFDMAVSQPEVIDLRSSEMARMRWPQRIIGVEVRTCGARDWSSLGNEDAAAMVAEVSPDNPGPAEDLAAQGAVAARDLRRAVRRTQEDILSQLSQRFFQAASAPLLLLLGAILATWKRHSLPLSIYLLSFIPAVANILLLASGQQLMRSGQVQGGFIMMLAGTVVLAIIGIVGYRRLSRN
ncbi:MAG: LptF/LptG family permease [Phycisphaeraceae bacterium]|nr:LptF/LptG family permease [Phycisphaeraceae bacterium]